MIWTDSLTFQIAKILQITKAWTDFPGFHKYSRPSQPPALLSFLPPKKVFIKKEVIYIDCYVTWTDSLTFQIAKNLQITKAWTDIVCGALCFKDETRLAIIFMVNGSAPSKKDCVIGYVVLCSMMNLVANYTVFWRCLERKLTVGICHCRQRKKYFVVGGINSVGAQF